MVLKTLGKTLLTGLVGLAGAASCIAVFVLFIGGQAHFGGSHAFLAIASPHCLLSFQRTWQRY